MHHLIYVSSATRLMSRDELTDLLAVSRKNNKALGVTGMLLYRDGNFLQVLEGEKETLHRLYDTIQGDPRHHGCIRMLIGPVAAREFADWSMAFRNLDDEALHALEGYSDFLNLSFTDPAFTADPTRAQRLLHEFRLRM